jgi:ribosomal protein S18 acetylase RimI-like enzyme
MNHQLRIRPMLAEELPLAARYTLAEGWLGEDLASFVAFYQHDPGGCFFAERAGQVTGMVISTCYGQAGFIGELIVDPAARNQGIGAQLLDHAVAYLYSRNATTVYLDGVLKAVPLYERHGFRKLCRSLRFYGKLPGKTGTQVQPMLPEDLESVCALDRVAFGADRGHFLRWRLERYLHCCKVLVENGRLLGFIQGKAGMGWAVVGPWVVAKGTPKPERLLENLACEIGNQTIRLGVLESNQQAVALIRSLGLMESTDSPWRMSTGPGNELGASSACFAIGSPAKG